MGISLDESLPFKSGISSWSGYLNSIIAMMHHVSGFLDQKTMVNIYYTFFYSHTIYGIEFYGHIRSTELNEILTVQKKHYKLLKLHVIKFTCY